MRGKPTLLGAALIACSLPAVPAADALGSLTERLTAATNVAEGQAGRPYTAWNGTDPATIVTYTPFTVRRVLKGRLAGDSILVREPGGEIAGLGASGEAGTEFIEGERDVVLLGDRDPKDGSYPITINRAIYQVSRDANGQDGLDVHLGVDAGTYPSREKGSGTPPVHVPLELVERLAHGEDPAIARPSTKSASPSPAVPMSMASKPAPPPHRHGHAATGIVAALALIVALVWLTRRRRAPR